MVHRRRLEERQRRHLDQRRRRRRNGVHRIRRNEKEIEKHEPMMTTTMTKHFLAFREEGFAQ